MESNFDTLGVLISYGKKISTKSDSLFDMMCMRIEETIQLSEDY